MSSLAPPLIRELISLLGADAVRTAEDSRIATSAWSPVAIKARQAGMTMPGTDVIVTPGDVAAVSAVVLWANRQRIRLLPLGGGTTTVYAADDSDRPTVVLSLSRLDDIRWEESALTVTVGTGVVLADLEARLNAHEYTLGSLPQSARLATIGGAVATEAFGLFAAGYGGQRTMTVALEAVLPDGAIVRTTANGAAGRTLHHLLIGTAGAFGIVTAATLTMHPLPEVRAWCTFTFTRWSDAVDALRLIYRSDTRPAAIRLFDPTAAKERFGSAAPTDCAVLLLGFEGSELVQTGQYQTAYAVCQQIGGTEAPAIDGDAWFETERYRTDAFAANGRPGGLADVISVYAPWPTLTTLPAALTSRLAPLCSHVSTQIGYAEPTGAALDLRFEIDTDGPGTALRRHQELLHTAQQIIQEYDDATFAHHFGIGRSRADWAQTARGDAHTAALRALKAALDPNSIFPEVY